MPPAMSTPPVANTFSARLQPHLPMLRPASQLSRGTTRLDAVDRRQRQQSLSYDLSTAQPPAVPEWLPHRVEIHKYWERQFKRRHAPLPRARNEEEDAPHLVEQPPSRFRLPVLEKLPFALGAPRHLVLLLAHGSNPKAVNCHSARPWIEAEQAFNFAVHAEYAESVALLLYAARDLTAAHHRHGPHRL
jgi:hypothetical protein